MIQLHIRLPEDLVESIEEIMEGSSRTEKVQNFINSNIIGRGMLLLEKEKCEAKLRFIKQSLEQNPFYEIKVLSGPEQEFLKETIEVLDRNPTFKSNPSFMTARKNVYNDKFTKSISTKEFELLLYKFKDSK